MPKEGIDFEGNGVMTTSVNADGNPANEPDTTNLNGDHVDDVTGKDNNNVNNDNQGGQEGGQTGTNDGNGGNQNNEGGNGEDMSSTGEFEPGTEVEFDGNTYVIAENGDLIDDKGNVFVEKKNISNWLKENNVVNSDDNVLSIESIREKVGIDVTDENGNLVEFTNDADGVNNYINSVIKLRSKEISDGAVNKLFSDNPMLKQFIDYIQVTGSPKGFGDIPDRSNITLDKNNEHQLESIIRIAATEFGNKSLNDTYIKYLKESGALYDEAKSQLQALVGKDQAYRKEIETRAAIEREKELEDIKNYWQSVSDAIHSKKIGKYKLPDNFVKNINGQKITITLDDFYKYVAEATVENGEDSNMTGYQRDLNKLSKEEALNKELLDAWLMFTGGSYKDLVDMAINEEKAHKLIVKSKQNATARTIKINKPNVGKVNLEDIILS